MTANGDLGERTAAVAAAGREALLTLAADLDAGREPRVPSDLGADVRELDARLWAALPDLPARPPGSIA